MRRTAVALGLAIATLIPTTTALAAPAPPPSTAAPVTITVTATHFDPATGATLSTKVTSFKGTSASGSGSVPSVGSKVQTAAANPSAGCCSAAGGWNVEVTVTNGPSWWPNFIFHSRLIFCWGGGIAGVHWGWVYNCNAGAGVNPYTTQWFTSVSAPDQHPRALSADVYYGAWVAMNYSPNTTFHDFQQGAVDVCYAVCYYSHYPAIVIDAYANGLYTWGVNAG